MASLSSSAGAPFVPVKKGQWAHIPQFCNNCSIFAKCVCVTLCIGYLLSFSRTVVDLTTVSPGKLVPPNFWIWTLTTYSVVEIHWWILVLDVLAVILFSQYVEPVWTSVETLRFYLVVTVMSAISSVVTYLILYLPIQDTNLLFENHINGIAAFVAASTVAYKQLVPEAVIFSTPLGRMRSRNLPMWLFLIALLALLAGLIEHSCTVLVFWGAIVGWVYLRFYQPHSGGQRGDMTDSFSFANFFPDKVHPFVAILSNTIYAMLVAVNICKKVTKRFEVNPQPVIITLPGTELQDAERRRQLALKALNERLSRVPVAQPWPSVDEDSNVAMSSSTAHTQHTQIAVTSSRLDDDLLGPLSVNVNVNSFSTQSNDDIDVPS